MKLINKTPNGQIMYCSCHNSFHLEFGNLFVLLTPDELDNFRCYVNNTDYKYYLANNKDAQNRRKLLLQIGSKKLFLGLHAHEFVELRELLSLEKKTGIIENIEVIDYEMIFN